LAYRYCDNVWTFIMKDIEFHDVVIRPPESKVSKMKIVACEALAHSSVAL
uniref:TFIIA_gamma_C domain-containing protein n=1 Tax=Heligmosomoides polygyrus TaxID=6339 RepID=A0A183F4A9_HELPZ